MPDLARAPSSVSKFESASVQYFPLVNGPFPVPHYAHLYRNRNHRDSVQGKMLDFFVCHRFAQRAVEREKIADYSYERRKTYERHIDSWIKLSTVLVPSPGSSWLGQV